MLELVVYIAGVAGAIAALVWAKRALEAQVDTRIEQVLEFYVKEKNDFLQSYTKEKTALVESLPEIADKLGDIMFLKIRGMIAGQASGVARLDQGLTNAITEDLVNQQNPMIGGLINSFPAAKKWLGKNPGAAPQVMQLLGSLLGGGKALNPSSGDSSVAERMKRGFRFGST